MATKNKKADKRESVGVRYLFYLFVVALILLMGYYIYGYIQGTVSMETVNANVSIIFSFMLPAFVVAYLLLRGRNLKTIIKMLGLSRDKLNVTAFITGIKLLAIVFVFEVAISLFSQVTSIQLPTNVGTVLQGFPLYFLVFSFLIAPINEEIMFRGFLVPRIGIVLSAIIFAILHSGYASISEFAAALLFGLVAGYYYRKTGSLYATIFAHIAVNLITVVAFLSLGAVAVS